MRFGGQDAFTVTGDLSGPTVVAYARSDTEGDQVVARHSADGLTWSPPEATGVRSDLRLKQIAGNGRGQVVTTWTDGSYRSGLPLTVRFYAPETGWSTPTTVEGASGAAVALASDGRAALAYQAEADPTVAGLTAGGPMTVRRYAPATGWGATEIVHKEGGSVTALGFAGGDLVVAWRGSSGDGLVRALK